MFKTFQLIGRWLIDRKVKRRSKSVFSDHISKAKNVLIIANSNEADVEKALQNHVLFLRQQKINNLSLLMFSDMKNAVEIKTHTNQIIVTKKKFNWLGFPSDSEVRKIVAKRYSSIICLSLEPTYLMVNLIALINSNLKVGVSTKKTTTYFDLTIAKSSQKKDKFVSFVKNLNHYLDLINRK
tara:strand:- start:26281 stop:26826 length:546 start_codon:yes stop_codon:yes gene_type:complete